MVEGLVRKTPPAAPLETHPAMRHRCPLTPRKRTSETNLLMSAYDPKRTLLTLREKLIKIGAKVVRHGRYITFQLAEVAIPRSLFADILRLINRLRPAPLPP